MMDCTEIFYLINLELDGEISAHEQRTLDDHRATCPHCAALSEELRQMQIAMQTMENLSPSEGFKDRVVEKIQQETATPKVIPFRRKVMQYGGLAACAALCFGLFQLDFNSGITESASTSSSSAAPMSMSSSISTTTAEMESASTAESAIEDRAVAEIFEEETLEVYSTTTTTTATEDTAGGLTLPEQVAELLGVETVACIMILPDEWPDTLPQGVEELVEREYFSYAVVEPDYWDDVRIQFNFGVSSEVPEEGVPCIVIIMGE